MTTQLHIQPLQPAPGSLQSPADFGQQLIQALGMIAYTQQEILSLLSTSSGVKQPQQKVACSYEVKPFYELSQPWQQLDWLKRNWLGFNLDGTQKQKLHITHMDILEHERVVEAFKRMHNL